MVVCSKPIVNLFTVYNQKRAVLRSTHATKKTTTNLPVQCLDHRWSLSQVSPPSPPCAHHTTDAFCPALWIPRGGPAVGGLSSTAIYLLLGAIGLPVFSSGGGLGILLGPTGGGFLFGLLPAAFLSGLAGNYRKKDDHPSRYRMLCILFGLGATLVIYLAGVPYLKMVGNLSWKVAIQAGMLPFIPGDLLKLAIATHLAGTLHTRIEQFLG